ncbi:hypothetical protein chiPu_0002779 [Chiloscyllium punctatum]|uniref:Uncharacterized protein n=1 Tax=Chiloscyllium punctatum TaxID=137246 RepID=A0A401S1W0_CHIPU|nr:hypothetical protein [Chiloscyllium punctatum]
MQLNNKAAEGQDGPHADLGHVTQRVEAVPSANATQRSERRSHTTTAACWESVWLLWRRRGKDNMFEEEKNSASYSDMFSVDSELERMVPVLSIFIIFILFVLTNFFLLYMIPVNIYNHSPLSLRRGT